MSQKVIIVGAGLGGLTAALRLAKKGYEVHIIEKNNTAGGRLNQLKKDGFVFDVGPSFFSMSYEFRDLAKECNIELPFNFVELDPLYSVNISGNPKTFHLYKDMDKLSEQFKDIEPDFKVKMERYLNEKGKFFHSTIDVVIKNNFDSLADYFIKLARLNLLYTPLLLRSFWQDVKKHFDSAEAQQIISLVAFFLGRTPFDTMAIYTLLSYTEFKHDGYYNVEGGMYKIVEGMVKVLQKENVVIHYNTEITGFEADKNKLIHLTDKKGDKWISDIFLINADAAFFRGKILGRKKFSEERMKKMKWTMGYLTFYIGVKCKLPNVNHHNYYLGNNYAEYANKLLSSPGTMDKPYYYVNLLSKHNPGCAPEGCESLFFVCPVPNLLHKSDWSDKDDMVNSIIKDFSERIGVDITDQIISRTVYTPEDWQHQFNLFMGSGLGLAHSFDQIGAFRPKNVDELYKNVFYTGASTTPGAGLPMTVISSKLACERIYGYTGHGS